MEWVQNKSNRPIPEPYAFSADQRRDLMQLQRRSHLADWDEKYKRAPLTDLERARLVEYEATIRAGELVRYGGHELRFQPGDIYEVPDGHAARIAALRPECLRVLGWKDVRDLKTTPPSIHFETVQENIALAIAVSGGGDEGVLAATPIIEMKDGLMRYGDGAWQAIRGRS